MAKWLKKDVEKEDAVEEKQKEKTFVLCNFRLSPEESVELDKLASAAHLTKTAYIKERIFAPPVSAEVVKVSGELAKMSSNMKEVSNRLFDVEKSISVQTRRRIDGTRKDADVLMAKGNAILFAVAIFGGLSVVAVVGSAMILQRLILM